MAPLLGLIVVRDPYDRPTALRAGHPWQRLHLLVTARGLAAHLSISASIAWIANGS
jgi:hypothetical protein